MSKRTTIACLLPVAVAAALGGTALASGARPRAAAAKPVVLKLTADPNGDLKFDKRKLNAHHGTIVIQMMDPVSAGQQHGVAVKGNRVNKSGKIVDPGATSKVKLTLKPGRYTFFCPVPGHEAAGMKGTLTVK